MSLTDMLEAVMFLKDLQSRGLIIEISRGVWLRAPACSTTTSTSKTAGDETDFASNNGSVMMQCTTRLRFDRVIKVLDRCNFTVCIV